MKMFFRKIKAPLAALFIAVPLIASADPETWTLEDGKTFSGEFVTVISTDACFKNAKGRVVKVPIKYFSAESRLRIELAQPPTLSFEFVKLRDKTIFNTGLLNDYTQRPPEVRCLYGIRIKQKSTGAYNHNLYVELFVIGKERLGDKYILLDRQHGELTLTKANKREFELRSEREVTLRNFVVDRTVRGEKYHGYLAVVKDSRGEIIGVAASHKWLHEHVDNLRERYVGNFIDKTCTRVFPSRPPHYQGG